MLPFFSYAVIPAARNKWSYVLKIRFVALTMLLVAASVSLAAYLASPRIHDDPKPRPSPAVGHVPFYGVNGHYVQGGVYATNIAQQVADMKAMGITSIRQDCYSTADTATMASLVNSFAPVAVQPVFNAFPKTTDETTTYKQFYAHGQTVAGQLAGKVAVVN